MKRGKSKVVGYLLAIFLGAFGAHLFYYRKYVRGTIYLLFCWTYIPLFLGWIDLFFINKWNRKFQDESSKSEVKAFEGKKVSEKTNNENDYSTIGSHDRYVGLRTESDSPKKETKLILEDLMVKDKKTDQIFNNKASRSISAKKATFYNEDDIIIDKYLNLKTSKEILENFKNGKDKSKTIQTSQGISYEIAISSSYTNFVKDSIKYSQKREAKCPEIPLQAYWTTFDNLNSKQLKWYFYWREQVLKQNYIEVDLSYIFLFVYELLNYSFNQQAAFNISMLVHLYESYVETHPKLKNYLPKWIADMLYELGEIELGEEWDDKKVQLPKLYNQLNNNLESLEKLSITIWKPYIRNYRETAFFQSYKNKIYKTFKESIHLISDWHKEQGKELVEVWFEVKEVREVRHLFVGAVIGRENNPIHVYNIRYSETTSLYNEITTLFRLSENVVRKLNGEKREIKMDDDILPDDFKEKMLNKFSSAAKVINQRFKVVQQKEDIKQGSEIPERETQKTQSHPEPLIQFDEERIKELNKQSAELQYEFEGRANQYPEEELDSVPEVESSSNRNELKSKEIMGTLETLETSNQEQEYSSLAVIEPSFAFMGFGTDGDEEEFIGSLSNIENEFLSQLEHGKINQEEAKQFIKGKGLMLGMFVSQLNEKANECLGDNLLEIQGDSVVVYQEFEHIILKAKESFVSEN